MFILPWNEYLPARSNIIALWSPPYLLFWYQVLTCVSVRRRVWATSVRSETLKYFCFRNLPSRKASWACVNAVLLRLGLEFPPSLCFNSLLSSSPAVVSRDSKADSPVEWTMTRQPSDIWRKTTRKQQICKFTAVWVRNELLCNDIITEDWVMILINICTASSPYSHLNVGTRKINITYRPVYYMPLPFAGMPKTITNWKRKTGRISVVQYPILGIFIPWENLTLLKYQRSLCGIPANPFLRETVRAHIDSIYHGNEVLFNILDLTRFQIPQNVRGLFWSLVHLIISCKSLFKWERDFILQLENFEH